jgi:hypothetical protein
MRITPFSGFQVGGQGPVYATLEEAETQGVEHARMGAVLALAARSGPHPLPVMPRPDEVALWVLGNREALIRALA